MRAFLLISFLVACIASCASQKDMVHLNKQVNALYRQTKEDGEREEKVIGELEEILKEHEDAQWEISQAIVELEYKRSELEEVIARQASRQAELERQIAMSRELQEAERQKALGTVIREQDSLRTTIAQLQADLLGVNENIRVLTGKIEESNYLIKGAIEKDTTKTDAMASQMNELSLIAEDLSSRLGILENYVSAEIETKKERSILEKSSPPEQKRETKTIAPQKRELTESELYDRALGYHRDGRHQEAMADFNNFLKRYPKSELADNAHFWIGECYGARGKYEEAILAYQKVINDYPEGNKVPVAMLHQGFAFEKIDDKTTAELVFKKLVKNFPKTKEAEIAQKRLQRAR